jgi:hypothetical protein
VGPKTRTTKSDPPATRTHTPGFSAIQIREQLKRILASSDFANSERMCRFLKLAVEYAIDNRAGELKEYLGGAATTVLMCGSILGVSRLKQGV